MVRSFLSAIASLSLVVFSLACVSVSMAEDKAPPALAFKMESLDGKPVELKQYAGKVALVVNVASECGLTPQYTDLQEVYSKYKDKGLVVLGFPCNQFGGQEPGSSKEISEFCTTKYKITFDMFGKVDVNGDKACDLYKYLTSQETKPQGPGKISWNFEKFLIGRDGKVVARFNPRTQPDAPEVIEAIEKALAAK